MKYVIEFTVPINTIKHKVYYGGESKYFVDTKADAIRFNSKKKANDEAVMCALRGMTFQDQPISISCIPYL